MKHVANCRTQLLYFAYCLYWYCCSRSSVDDTASSSSSRSCSHSWTAATLHPLPYQPSWRDERNNALNALQPVSCISNFASWNTVSCRLRDLPSVLWRCWSGIGKGTRPVKNWVVGCWHGYLSGARCTVLWRCWSGIGKGTRPVKNWVVGCWHGYLSGARCRGPADATATHCLLFH